MLSFYLILIASLYLEPLSDMTCSVSAQMPSCIYLGTAPASTSISSLSGNSIHWGYPKPIQTYHHPSLGLPVSIQSWLQPKLPSPKTSYSTTSLLLNPRSCFVSSEMSWFFFFFFFMFASKIPVIIGLGQISAAVTGDVTIWRGWLIRSTFWR